MKFSHFTVVSCRHCHSAKWSCGLSWPNKPDFRCAAPRTLYLQGKHHRSKKCWSSDLASSRVSSVSVYYLTTQPAGVTLQLRSNKKVCWDVICKAPYLFLNWRSYRGSIHISIFLQIPIDSQLQSTHFAVCVCAECVVSRWGCVCVCVCVCGWMRARSLQPLSGIGSGVGRCGNHSIFFYRCNHRTVTPTWTTPGNKEATERKEKERPAVMNLIRS